MPLMIKLNRNIMKVDLYLNNGHFITVIYTTNITNSEAKYWKMHHFFEYNKLLDIIVNEKKLLKKRRRKL